MRWLLLLAVLSGLACDEPACTKCKPGTRLENPDQYCSRCLPVDGSVGEAGTD
jgi:hypothetical protein